MPLKLEQEGLILDTLEMRIHIIGEEIGYGSKPLLSDQIGCTIDGSIQRIPPLWCEKRKLFLNYYLPSAFLKCIRYSSNFLAFILSMENLVMDLLAHAFLLGHILSILKLTYLFWSRLFPFIFSNGYRIYYCCDWTYSQHDVRNGHAVGLKIQGCMGCSV